MTKPLVLAVLLLCQGLALGADARSTCPDKASSLYYFPDRSFEVKAQTDAFIRGWYSKHLRAMSEPTISCGSPLYKTSFRFVWLRTFHHPVAVRISYSRKAATIAAIELDGAGGYEPGKVLHKSERSLTSTQVSALETALTASGFWSTHSVASERGHDGSEWIFEGRSGALYHAISIWSPDSGPYRALGELLLQLSGLAIPSNELY